ncbi:MAG: phosphomannomutase/phosphoglucomutase, partial [Firmicutes bacterium]|nr:phosphomannomutase/phosphoglucomutase [Bacillota bacterium]
ITAVPFLSEYAAYLRKMICDAVGKDEAQQPLSGLKLTVDAGNGAGGFYASDVLAPLGADVTGSINLEPDGMFPNHIPNPENEYAMQCACEATVRTHADLGIIFDTDVDRAGAVGSDGTEINRNRLVALASVLALEDCPGGTVVTDSITSSGLKVFIEQELGGKHHRFRRGYKNVIDEAVRLCGEGQTAPLAIETSGHAAFRSNYFLDDGAYLITRIVIKLAQLRGEGRTIDQLIGALKEPAERFEVRLGITEEDFRPVGERVIGQLEQFAAGIEGWQIADDNREGVRVSDGDSWFLLRLSVHDPVMPLNFESDSVGGCMKMARMLADFFATQSGLDTAPIENFVKQG